VACEEFLEMSGVVAFIYAFLSYIEPIQPSSLKSMEPLEISNDYINVDTQGKPSP
jgi:hypothetical protein